MLESSPVLRDEQFKEYEAKWNRVVISGQDATQINYQIMKRKGLSNFLELNINRNLTQI